MQKKMKSFSAHHYIPIYKKIWHSFFSRAQNSELKKHSICIQHLKLLSHTKTSYGDFQKLTDMIFEYTEYVIGLNL